MVSSKRASAAPTNFLYLTFFRYVGSHLVLAHLVGSTITRAIVPCHLTALMECIIAEVTDVLLTGRPDELTLSILLVCSEFSLECSSISLLNKTLSF